MSEEKKLTFQSLTPEVQKNNNPVYDEALDYAYSNPDIKNIAITGIYGAGKSTVWKTYINNNERFKNNKPITVSLGLFEDEELLKDSTTVSDSKSETVHKVDNLKKLNKSTNKVDYQSFHTSNRIEKQIINQILSQVDSNKISASKYQFKTNNSFWTNANFVLSIFLIILSLTIISMKEKLLGMEFLIVKFEDKLPLYYVFAITLLLFISIVCFVWYLKKKNNFRISKINIKGSEASLDEDNDETILDKDIKELVYILNNSKVDTIIFEDLDRYDDISIFTKLRELNFLLNQYIFSNTKNKNRSVKFFYMIRDGMFCSKNRTKFFDFIIPIVPIVNSNNSENVLKSILLNTKYAPSETFLFELSLYIDDMRLLKNIVNEYNVYSNIMDMERMSLISNKLFALVVYKNIFPEDFDLLQEDKGYIYELLLNINDYRENLRDRLTNEVAMIDEKIENLKAVYAKSKFEYLASCIPASIHMDVGVNLKWPNFLNKWSNEKSKLYFVRDQYSGHGQSYNYEEFINRYCSAKKDKEIIESIPVELDKKIAGLKDTRSKINEDIKNISSMYISQVVTKMNSDEVNRLFLIEGYERIISSHYFPMIKLLIKNGYIDESYIYYRGCFHEFNEDGCIGINDAKFIKNILEGNPQGISLDLEHPLEVMQRLRKEDYQKFNILNQRLFKVCVEQNQEEKIKQMTDVAIDFLRQEDLIEILESLKEDELRTYVTTLIDCDNDPLVNILENCELDNQSLIGAIVKEIFKFLIPSEDCLKKYKRFMENSCHVLLQKDTEINELFYSQLEMAEVKFKDISCLKENLEVLKIVEERNLYDLNYYNVLTICIFLYGLECTQSNILKVIYHNDKLNSLRQNIDNNFIYFLMNYINMKPRPFKFDNGEDILINILNSDLDVKDKLNYLSFNKTVISALNSLENLKQAKDNGLIERMFELGSVKDSVENLKTYISIDNSIDDCTFNLINKNQNNIEFIDNLVKDSDLIEKIAYDDRLSIQMFNIIFQNSKEKVNLTEHELSLEKIAILIKYDCIDLNENNIKLLLDKMSKISDKERLKYKYEIGLLNEILRSYSKNE